MKTAIIIPTYNRPEYLKKCFNSLKKTFVPRGTFIYIIDDCSTDINTIKLIKAFKINGCEIKKEFKKKNNGINNSLFTCYEYLFNNDYNFVIVLDSDAIVNNYFYDMMIYYHKIFPNNIISGFNTLTTNELNKQRHPVIEDGKWYVKKNTSGALCIGITKQIYEKYTKPVLEHLININKILNFDTTFTSNASKDNINAICTVPSVAEHIGIEYSTLGHNYNPDVSCDFKMIERLIPNKNIDIFIASLYRNGHVIKTIESLINQENIKDIYLVCNNYTDTQFNKISKKLNKYSNIKIVRKNNEKGCSEKFYLFKNSNAPYICTCDDDLIYPDDYLKVMQENVDKYNAIISLHGRIKKEGINTSYYLNNKASYHFAENLDEDKEVEIIGTGVCMFKRSFIPTINELYDKVEYPNMSDIYLSGVALEYGIKRIVIKHKKNYINHKEKEKDDNYIYDRYVNNDKHQTDVFNNMFRSVKKQYKNTIINNNKKYDCIEHQLFFL